jgi:hypothetical protein
VRVLTVSLITISSHEESEQKANAPINISIGAALEKCGAVNFMVFGYR